MLSNNNFIHSNLWIGKCKVNEVDVGGPLIGDVLEEHRVSILIISKMPYTPTVMDKKLTIHGFIDKYGVDLPLLYFHSTPGMMDSGVEGDPWCNQVQIEAL